MFALVTAVVLVAAPAVKGDFAVTGGGGFNGDSFAFGPHVSARLTVEPPENFGGVIAQLWVRGLWWPGFETSWGLESNLSLRVSFGRFSAGVDGELRNIHYDENAEFMALGLHAGVGPSLAYLFVDDGTFRVDTKLAWMPLATVIDIARVSAQVEFSWKALTIRAMGGTVQYGRFRPSDFRGLVPHFGLYVGGRFTF